MDDNFPDIHERVTAGRLLSITAANISSRLDSFCSWLLIGVGGAYALILANLESLQDLIEPSSLQKSLLLLLIAIVLGIFQRWLAAMVASGAEVAEKASQIGQELSERGIEIDFKIVFREIEKGLFYPSKWISRNSFNKAMSGDFAAPGRFTAFISQIQSWLALALIVFIVAAISETICGVNI